MLSVIWNIIPVVYIRTHQTTSKNIDLPLRANYCCGKHVNPLLNHKHLLLEAQICEQKCHKQQVHTTKLWIVTEVVWILWAMGCRKLVKGEYMNKVYIYIVEPIVEPHPNLIGKFEPEPNLILAEPNPNLNRVT